MHAARPVQLLVAVIQESDLSTAEAEATGT
jgi:hypothetical protein